MNSLRMVLYVLGLYSAFMAGSSLLRNQSSLSLSNPKKFHFPLTTILLLLAIALPSILQFFFPMLLPMFQRDNERFLSGEWWRLFTPIFFQDGGLSGTIFNLISLLLIGSVAEKLWGGRSMLIIFFMGGIIGEMVAFAWQPIGAGNSICNFSLAASIAIACLVRHPPRSIQIAALFALSICGMLVWWQDIHGAAALAGAIQALFLNQVRPDKSQ